ncbi:MAG: hypothetical protein IJI53_08020 [Clostridia bacterium]|nr:hypothetical protein [Clostridia bacterium]
MAVTVIHSSSGRQDDQVILMAKDEGDLQYINPNAKPGTLVFSYDGKHIWVKDDEGAWNDWLAENEAT